MSQIPRQQHPGRRRVRHHPFQPVLGGLGPHPQRPQCRIQIIGAQRAQLLSAQRRVIGQREHHPVTDRLVAGDVQDVRPLPLTGDPRQLGQPRYQASLLTAEPPARRVPTAPDRVGLPQALLDQEVVEQPNRHQPLLDRGVRQPSTRIQRHHIRPTPTRPRGQLPHEHRDMRPARSDGVDALAVAHLQILGQPTRVRINSPRRPPQINPDVQPLGRPPMPPQNRPLLLQHHRAQHCPSSPWVRPKRP